LNEFLEKMFPESRRKAYYLMSIHERLPPQARQNLIQVGVLERKGIIARGNAVSHQSLENAARNLNEN